MATKKFRCSECGHTWEVAYGAPRLSFCPECKCLTSIGQKKIEVMLVEAVEEEVVVV
jgi:transposase-like protein